MTFFVLNLRMGGQVSNLISLQELLTERGVRVRWALPASARSLDKAALTRFSQLRPWARIASTLQCLRALPRTPGDVVHMVLPTPSFTPLCALASTPHQRILVQSEGLPTAFDDEHLALLGANPALMLPRMLLNHRALVRAARHLPVAHLVTAPSYAATLRTLGYRNVSCIENVARFGALDRLPLPVEVAALFAPGRTVVGYVGHAHAVKGVEDLVDAFAIGGRARPDMYLLLALSADGSTDRLRQRAAALPRDLRARVHVTGLVPVGTLLSRLDALVLPYRSIATTTIFPSLLLEADVASCPVIVCDVPPLGDIMPPSCPTFVRVPARSPAALANALRDVEPRRAHRAQPRLRLPSEAERADQLVELYRRLSSA